MATLDQNIATLAGFETPVEAGDASHPAMHTALHEAVGQLKTLTDTKAASSHTHTAATISDFTEAVQDAVAGLLGAATLQAETLACQARMAAVSGKIGAAALGVIDRFVARGKSMTWFSLILDCWVPAGDFAASKVRLVQGPTTWVFNNFVAADYSEGTGYVSRNEGDLKYISTGFIPTAQGLNSKNISLAYASTVDVRPGSFARVIGTATNETIFCGSKENIIGVGSVVMQNAFLLEGTVVVQTNGASLSRCFLNGTLQQEVSSQTTTLSDEINLFRAMRGNGLNYAQDSCGFYAVATDMSAALALDFSQAIVELMTGLREVYQRPYGTTHGDSIGAGTAAMEFRPGRIFFRELGLRERCHAQGNSRLDGASVGTTTIAQRALLTTGDASSVTYLQSGTNDMASDLANDGNTGGADTYYNALNNVGNQYQIARKKLLVACPPWRGDASSQKQLLYAQKAADSASAFGHMFVDLYNLFIDLGVVQGNGPYGTYFNDSVHPKEEGGRMMGLEAARAFRGEQNRRPTLDFPSIAAGATSAAIPVTVFMARVGMTVRIAPMGALEAGLLPRAWVSASGVVSVTLTNLTAAAIDPAALKYHVQVLTN